MHSTEESVNPYDTAGTGQHAIAYIRACRRRIAIVQQLLDGRAQAGSDTIENQALLGVVELLGEVYSDLGAAENGISSRTERPPLAATQGLAGLDPSLSHLQR